MNKVTIEPDEYQARPRHTPPIFLSALAVMVLAFGGTLTIALPWNMLDLINGREFQDLSRFQRFVWELFAVFSFIMLLRWCTVQFLAFRGQLSKRTTACADISAWPSVSILVPAYQEAENIESTLRSLVELEYPHYEIIVVDDGSSDDTFAKAHKFSGKSGTGTITVLRKDNGGKWSALKSCVQTCKVRLYSLRRRGLASQSQCPPVVDFAREGSPDRRCMWASHRPQSHEYYHQTPGFGVCDFKRGIENRAKSPWFGDGCPRSDRTLPEIEFGTDCPIGR